MNKIGLLIATAMFAVVVFGTIYVFTSDTIVAYDNVLHVSDDYEYGTYYEQWLKEQQQTAVEYDPEKAIVCWQGKPYHSYWNEDIGLHMADQARELNGVQQLILDETLYSLCGEVGGNGDE